MPSQLNDEHSERQRAQRDLVRNYDSSAQVDYQIRAVAFIDILGWRQAVEASKDDDELRRLLLNSLWGLLARTKDYVETETAEMPSEDEFSQFSDSIIVSFPYNDYRDLVRLLRFVAEFQDSMVLKGLPLRGGVTVGPLFHTDTFAFGPAMNRAYELESKFAKFPRIIVDSSLEREIESAIHLYPKHWPFVVRANDGFYETEFLFGFSGSERLSGIIDQRIEGWIAEHQDNHKVLEKYRWLRNRWQVVKRNAQRGREISKQHTWISKLAP